MCGLCGIYDINLHGRVDLAVLSKMTDSLAHRGPDSSGYHIDENIGIGFRRLKIMDPEHGDQPIYNEDGSLALFCNGEIYNYRELSLVLKGRGHVLKTTTDVEVLLHLYEEFDVGVLDRVNGQFAFAIYDSRRRRVFLARDHFGIIPLYYAVFDGIFLFASEIKAILQHPCCQRMLDFSGLDQVMTFPGLVSPTTMFRGIQSLKAGNYLEVNRSGVMSQEYWDLEYPPRDAIYPNLPEETYVEEFGHLLTQSIARRLHAEVPVAHYFSGGLDSSVIAAIASKLSAAERHVFSINFPDRNMDEARYQLITSRQYNLHHSAIMFNPAHIYENFISMLYHAECPVKETYNVCSLLLSDAVRSGGFKVVLSGEGADEFLAGYVGYRFDELAASGGDPRGAHEPLEMDARLRLWGSRHIFYEKNYFSFALMKKQLYSNNLRACFDDFDSCSSGPVNRARLQGKHPLHQRSYLDFKLRLSDHLLADHGDRMAMANSVEARYPFLDIDLVKFLTIVPPQLKLNKYSEKYLLKRYASRFLDARIIHREKFGFHAPGTPTLLQGREEWAADLLSYGRIQRQGYFDPDAVEAIKVRYSEPGFRLNLPFEDDLLAPILSFGVFLDLFNLPELG